MPLATYQLAIQHVDSMPHPQELGLDKHKFDTDGASVVQDFKSWLWWDNDTLEIVQATSSTM